MTSNDLTCPDCLCGCCEPGAPATPLVIDNRPGLSAIAYRIGTFAAFRRAMLEALGRELPALATREPDDHAVTVLEMWAAAADVLTFYQERIANGAYLRTAEHRDQVLRLARLIDYQLRPGLAAEARVAFTLDDNHTLTIPVGTRLMSVPGPDEKPQFFETLAPLAADWRLNRVRILPVPHPLPKLHEIAPRVPVDELPERLAQGDPLALFDAERLEPKQVEKIEATDYGRYLSFSPPVQADFTKAKPHPHARKIRRELRFFGHNAPDQVTVFKPGKLSDDKKKWLSAPYWEVVDLKGSGELKLPLAGDLYPLDRVYDDLRPGAVLLIEVGGSSPTVALARIDKVVTSAQTLGQLQGTATPAWLQDTVTAVKLSGIEGFSLPAIPDRRVARVFEVDPQPIMFREHDYAATLTGNALAVPLTLLDALEAKRTIVLDDGTASPHAATVTGTQIDDATEHLLVSFTPALPEPLDRAKAVMRANVAWAGHGETQAPEILGDGDGTKAFQRFTLRKAPLTFRPSGAEPAGESTAAVTVNGERWSEAESLLAAGPADKAYALRQNDDGTTAVRFGDGRNGARLPTGSGNVQAVYRQGLGLEGRVAAGQLSILLTRPPGLKEAVNPLPAEGGADPETLDQARTTAPTTVLTMGRAVSLLDHARLAEASGEVARAAATWVWRGLEKAVHLTVAAQGGAALSNDALKRLHRALDAARDPNHALLLGNVLRLGLRIEGTVFVEPAFEREAVVEAARRALLAAFAFERVPFADAVHLSDIYAVLHGVPGVRGVDLDTFHYAGGQGLTAIQLQARGATADPLQPHLRLFAARPRAQAKDDPLVTGLSNGSLPEVVPAEQAKLVPGDIRLTGRGGLA